MADTTTTTGADAYAGQKGAPAGATNQANKAPADQTGYDPKDAKWASIPGAAAREAGYPRLS